MTDLMNLWFRGIERRGCITVLECYFDDSGTHGPSKVVAWGGLFGRPEQWDKLDKEWRSLLNDPIEGTKPPLRQFHLSHCAALDGEFSSYSRAESDLIRWKFRQIIADSGVEGIAIAISRDDYREVVRGRAKKEWGNDAEQVAIKFVIGASYRFAEGIGESVFSVLLDQGRRSPTIDKWIEEGFKLPSGNVTPCFIGWGKVGEVSALQAADTIATEAYWIGCASLLKHHPDVSPHLNSLAQKIPVKIKIYRKDELEGVVSALNKKYRLLSSRRR